MDRTCDISIEPVTSHHVASCTIRRLGLFVEDLDSSRSLPSIVYVGRFRRELLFIGVSAESVLKSHSMSIIFLKHVCENVKLCYSAIGPFSCLLLLLFLFI